MSLKAAPVKPLVGPPKSFTNHEQSLTAGPGAALRGTW